LLGVFYY